MKRNVHIAVLAVLASASPLAFQGDPSVQRNRTTATMQSCQDEMKSTRATIDRLAVRLKDARQSDDPAVMRVALDEVLEHLSTRQNGSAACMQMMEAMASMPAGAMSGMMGQGMGESQQPAGTAGMMQGACCPPRRGLHGAAMIAAWTGGALLYLATLAVLGALALFLLRRSQAAAR